MNNNHILMPILLCAATMSTNAHARVPLWTFTPITSPTQSVPVNDSTFVNYRVTLQSPVTHTLKMVPINGITQITTGGNCTDPFTLSSSNPSCTLSLLVNGSELPAGGITQGPKVCQQGPDGNPSSLQCYQPSQNDSLSISVAPASFAPFTYVTNFNGETVSKCQLDAITGALSYCVYTGDRSFFTPYGIVLGGGYAYVANRLNDTVSKCSVDQQNGALNGCQSTGSGFHLPSAITINNGYVYVVNYGSVPHEIPPASVSKCVIGSSGALTNCIYTDTEQLLNGPGGGIAVYNDRVYISNGPNNNVIKCDVNPSTGDFTNCNAETSSEFIYPVGVALSNGYAYIPNYYYSSSSTDAGNTITQCAVDLTTGSFYNCQNTEGGSKGAFIYPDGIGIHNGYAYINNYGSSEDPGTSSVSRCNIDPTTGALSSCIYTGEHFRGPAGNIGF